MAILADPDPDLNRSKLRSVNPDLKLKAVRSIKNAIIGNKTKKHTFRDTIPIFLDIIANDTDVFILIQAAQVLGSFACGYDDGVRAVLEQGGLPPLFALLSHTNIKVVESAARSLRIIYQSKLAPRAQIFQGSYLTQLVALLSSNNDVLSEVAASIIAQCCESSDHQMAVAELHGLHPLLNTLSSKFPKSQEAALECIACLTRQNDKISVLVAEREEAVNQIMRMLKEKRARVRLLACTAIANLNRSRAIPNRQSEVQMNVLPTIVKLFNEEDPIREEAPLVLAHLISDSEDLQKAASESDAIAKLAAFVQAETSPFRLKETALIALAALCESREESRRQVIDVKVLPAVVTALEHSDAGIRAAACSCARSLSRSVKVLRTSLVDAGIALPLCKLLEDSSTAVQIATAATVCNIVLDFSPMKKIILENGGVSKLVALTHSMDATLRLNCLWALKNLVFHADPPTKETVMRELPFECLYQLANDPEPPVQEQALTLLRNLACGNVADIQRLMTWATAAGGDLLDMVSKPLSSDRSDVALQALYCVSNLANGTEDHKNAILSNKQLLTAIIVSMSHPKSELRIAAIWCIINLTWKDDPGAEERVTTLRELGVLDRLNGLSGDADCRDTLQTALTHFANSRV
mmetsp:Transcript_53933/g.89750  ORF Transcript_53933/g.89750 Transcript_53933/m.89750 type:complete len:639 (+) Transcript_53933:58-1974(+)